MYTIQYRYSVYHPSSSKSEFYYFKYRSFFLKKRQIFPRYNFSNNVFFCESPRSVVKMHFKSCFSFYLHNYCSRIFLLTKSYKKNKNNNYLLLFFFFFVTVIYIYFNLDMNKKKVNRLH